MSEGLAIEIRDLEKSYGRVRALRGVNLEVRLGEIFAFLGPNGAGKTTTIRCMLDFIRPDRGSIRVLGIDPQRDPVAVRRRVGYLPGELHFDENLTVEEALRFFAAIRGSTVDWSYVRSLADRLDLDLRPRIRNLSKGNKQKVGVIQAMMHRPELLILDEPTLGLDPLMQREVLRLVREAQAAGAAVFFSSHIMSEVEQVADRVGIIRQGVVVEVARTADLIHRAMRRVRVRFQAPVDPQPLLALPGVRLLRRENEDEFLLQVEGIMDPFIKVLAAFPVQYLETERPSLEEIFLAYYEPSPEVRR
ncbi:ABC transporter ATP-binding protein [Thermus islandicus]|uniref:ABC transporter ATP-binding protein n=1 Tax=Thermus islandicus TaxID=540988 RepID=UPI00048B22EB|nr:ABC transporter ATP-binding protein [Thermus islandicus]